MLSSEERPFPTNKLLTPTTDATPVVLLACGSFSPITNMHLRLFEDVRSNLQSRYPEFEVIGGYLSPVTDAYKKKGLASATHRLNMCKLAVESSDWIMVDDWECSQSEYQRTVLVLNYFERRLNQLVKTPHGKPIRVMLICGSDLLASFNSPGVWSDEDLHEILGKYGVVCLKREGSDPNTIIMENDILYKHQNNILLVPQWIPNDVSSTRIRLLISRGLSIRYLTPDPVVKYIEEHNLWKSS